MNSNNPEHIFLCAGENSGDMHGAELIQELLRQNSSLQITCVGGDRSQNAGATLIEHIRHLSCNGIVEVIKKLPRLRKIYHKIIRHLKTTKPGTVVLIDFPDFNMRVAKAAKKLGMRVIWYISPTVWAWRKYRIFKLAKIVDMMLVILPFEKKLYETAGLDTRFVGNPILDSVRPSDYDRSRLRARFNFAENDFVLGLLPGSRPSEFQRLFPRMQDTLQLLRGEHPELRAVVSCAPSLDLEQCKKLDRQEVEKTWITGQAHEIMAMTDFCIVASGTATLETAIFGTPMVVVYQLHPISFFLGKLIIHLEHFALVNILAGREVVPERIQQEVNPPALANTVKGYWSPGRMAQTRRELQQVRDLLGEPGASRRAAQAILGQSQSVANENS
ncbi:lipid-A-disaccharide synthase [Planctomycetota bacterium]